MAKEDYTTPLADEYMRTHKELKSDNRKWYEKYLPGGVTAKDITPKHEPMLIEIFSKCEEEAEKYLEEVTKKSFDEHIKCMMDESLKKYLPLRPKIIWSNLSIDQKTYLTKIYKNCLSQGENEKTIKKQFRNYLDEFFKKDKHDKLKTEDIQNLLEKWIDEKIEMKGYVSKKEDFEDFHRIFSLAERTFSTRLRNSNLTFKKGKWLRE